MSLLGNALHDLAVLEVKLDDDNFLIDLLRRSPEDEEVDYLDVDTAINMLVDLAQSKIDPSEISSAEAEGRVLNGTPYSQTFRMAFKDFLTTLVLSSSVYLEDGTHSKQSFIDIEVLPRAIAHVFNRQTHSTTVMSMLLGSDLQNSDEWSFCKYLSIYGIQSLSVVLQRSNRLADILPLSDDYDFSQKLHKGAINSDFREPLLAVLRDGFQDNPNPVDKLMKELAAFSLEDIIVSGSPEALLSMQENMQDVLRCPHVQPFFYDIRNMDQFRVLEKAGISKEVMLTLIPQVQTNKEHDLEYFESVYGVSREDFLIYRAYQQGMSEELARIMPDNEKVYQEVVKIAKNSRRPHTASSFLVKYEEESKQMLTCE